MALAGCQPFRPHPLLHPLVRAGTERAIPDTRERRNRICPDGTGVLRGDEASSLMPRMQCTSRSCPSLKVDVQLRATPPDVDQDAIDSDRLWDPTVRRLSGQRAGLADRLMSRSTAAHRLERAAAEIVCTRFSEGSNQWVFQDWAGGSGPRDALVGAGRGLPRVPHLGLASFLAVLPRSS
jgi:hypothetical protein